MINFKDVRTFQGGYSTDLTDNVEQKNTYQKAIGGRLYSKNGVLSFSGGKGSKLIYQNETIVKYLGYYPFKDEFLVFAKCEKGTTLGGATETVCNDLIQASSFIVINDSTDNTAVSLTSELIDNSDIYQDCYEVYLPPTDPTDFENDYSCENAEITEVDFGEYYIENANVPNRLACSFNLNETPINNLEYDDCLISFTLDDEYNLIGTLLWVGWQNWPLNGKITCEGVDENEYYKRVYYTDAVNPRRVVNRKDSKLAFRQPGDFNQILNNVLLQPEIVEITEEGQIKAMKSLYVYRIISENGQASEFSPSSFYADILYDHEAIKFRGGNISETTNKAVKVKCNIINADSSSEIECIALEYEAGGGVPTAIRNLGRKSAATVVEFTHFGNEAEFADNITYKDIIDYKNTWLYCNDFSSKKNKLIAGGLRNQPLPTEINNLEYLFPLHSWKSDGSTHDCLMNPMPWEFRYIDPTNTDSLIYVKQKVYRTISSFGPLTLTLKNTSTGNEIVTTFDDLPIESYTNILQRIITWLLDQQLNNANWSTYFPNLTIEDIQGQLLFKPTDDLIQTDFSNYVFSSNNNQFIENFDNDIVFLPVTVNTSSLVHGAQSIGFNEGTGIRVTYQQFKEPLLNQATKIYDGTDNVLDYITPSGETYFMKGELYRLAFQAYNNDSTRFFSIPLGDVMIPALGDLISSIDDSGNPIITSQKYVNQSIENGVLYGHGIKMKIEVRLNCELQSLIPMYQLVYVERTEDNRTILCQGISAPLERVQDNGDSDYRMPDDVRNKWTLPYYGGPTYEKKALENYDNYGEDDQYTANDHPRRVMTNRSLMYFDSPDLYYEKISDQYVKTSKINILAKLRTDHTPEVIREHGGVVGTLYGTDISYGDEVYPKFSRKILEDNLEGEINAEDLPRAADEVKESGTFESYFINVSVFANYSPFNREIVIKDAIEMKRGEVIAGTALALDNALSNNSFGLPSQPWYYGSYQRDWKNQSGRPNAPMFAGALTSPGYKTIFIKTEEDLFDEAFHGPVVLPKIDSQIRLGGTRYGECYDVYPLINLVRNNRESIFGGRTVEAYSKNTYIPLSRTIPTLKSSNNAQIFTVGGDVRVTLNIRTKNDAGNDEIIKRDFNNHGGARDKGDIENVWLRNAAWVYAVVLETQVEPKWSYDYEFYRESNSHSFEAERGELINNAYFNTNTLKSYAPKPFKFKDDPNQDNIIAVSDVKLAGEYYDAWTIFKPNNFYAELEKNKGFISNLFKQEDTLFVIQEQQTSELYIGVDRLITDQQGNPINIQQGSGTVVEGHKVISKFGTSIRRAVVESEYGATFFDERKIEFVKIKEPLLIKNFLHLEYFNRFKEDKIIDTEAYFDQENKETCVRIRTKNGNNFMLSYNERLQVFNGEFPIQYDKDIFIQWDEKIYAPITIEVKGVGISSYDLHQLNEGDILNFFNEQTELVIGVKSAAQLDKVIQFKNSGLITNLDYPIKSAFGNSNLGYDRTILGTHNWYKIREGTHTFPMINDTSQKFGISDIRGNWIYIEITAESLNKNKVDILAILNDLRYSHQ